MLEFWQVVVVVWTAPLVALPVDLLVELLVELTVAWQTERPAVAEQVNPAQQPEK